MRKLVDTFEDRIQKPILTAFNSSVAPKIESAIKSINASSAQDPTSVTANSKRREQMGSLPFLKKHLKKTM